MSCGRRFPGIEGDQRAAGLLISIFTLGEVPTLN